MEFYNKLIDCDIEIGVALLIDTVKIASESISMGAELERALNMALASIIIPQLEGLSLDKLRKIGEIFKSDFSEAYEAFRRYFPEVI